jgi:hypothetical protein
MATKSVLERLAAYGYGQDTEIATTDLVVPEEFQRKLKPRNWDLFVPMLFGRLIVARLKDGRLVIVDGQHRWEKAKEWGMENVPCILFEDVSVPDAAAMFDICNSDRVAIPPADEFRAACISEDQEAQELDAALLERDLDGWCQDRAEYNLRPISSLRKLQRDVDLDHTLYSLDVISEVWPWDEVKGSPHVRCIRGFGQFLRPEKMVLRATGGRKRVLRRWDEADRELLVSYLREHYHGDIGLDNWLMRAERAARGGGGGGGSLGMEIVLRKTLTDARREARAAAEAAAA